MTRDTYHIAIVDANTHMESYVLLQPYPSKQAAISDWNHNPETQDAAECSPTQYREIIRVIRP
jgi:hypothetical protein